MAIAHVATKYVFSDFLLKEPSEPKFKGLRLELAVDKMVRYSAVGLPLLLISLAYAGNLHRYTNKLFLPKLFLLASGCLRGFLLLGGCAADGLLAGELRKLSPVPA